MKEPVSPMKTFSEESDFSDLTIKLASASKSKRLGRTPQSYQDLSATVEALIKEERLTNPSGKKDYAIRYQDGDSDIINVSDDEDLQVAYKVARKELGGVLKFSITMKAPVAAAPVEKVDEAKIKARKALKEEKKKNKESKKKRSLLAKASQADKLNLHQQAVLHVDGMADTLKAKLGKLTQAIGAIVKKQPAPEPEVAVPEERPSSIAEERPSSIAEDLSKSEVEMINQVPEPATELDRETMEAIEQAKVEMEALTMSQVD